LGIICKLQYMQYASSPDLDYLPEKSSTLLRTTQALLSKLALGLPLLSLLCNSSVVSCGAGTSNIIEGKFRESWNVLQRKESELVQVLVGSIGNNCHNSKIWLARVIDEPGGTGHKLSVDLVRFASEALFIALGVVKLVQSEQIQVLAIFCSVAAAVSFLGGDDFANISVDKLAFPDVFSGTNTCRKR
jgi:hypothetical protein